ncbi:gypsy ty-3 retroelement related protein [Cyclospora cayetanensis]|uniref:Gypsy ty-3 retroelement related protein n=1 Tax=Cyclospora cayetanensis TaxID=88456 RepID=A0A1D3CX80_9EIME|nr:gypsy ty-3 retroelement related protein [Cyclospora cayetanensis]
MLPLMSGVERVPQRGEADSSFGWLSNAVRKHGFKHSSLHTGSEKDSVLEYSIEHLTKENQIWANIMKGFADVLNNDELRSGWPPGRPPAHRIELIPGSASCNVRRHPKPSQHVEEMGRQADDLLKSKEPGSTSADEFSVGAERGRTIENERLLFAFWTRLLHSQAELFSASY